MTTYVLPRSIDPATIVCAVAAPDRKHIACSIAGKPPFTIRFVYVSIRAIPGCGNAVPYAWTADGLYLRDGTTFYRWRKKGGTVALAEDPGVAPNPLPLSSLVAPPPPPPPLPTLSLEQQRQRVIEGMLRETGETLTFAGGLTARVSRGGVVVHRNGVLVDVVMTGDPAHAVALSADGTLLAVGSGDDDDSGSGTVYSSHGTVHVFRMSDGPLEQISTRKLDEVVYRVRFDENNEVIVNERSIAPK